MPSEWTRYYREPEWNDLCVLHARFRSHRFPRHAHDYYVVGYVASGLQSYNYRGARHITGAGQVFLVNPGEVHTGEPADSDGYLYRTMYPQPELLERVVEDVTGHRELPFFRGAVLDDRILSQHLQTFHKALSQQTSKLAMETALIAALARLILRHADRALPRRHVGRERTAVRRAREYIEANFAASVTLSKLSAISGLSPFHLARVFERQTGIPPHGYLERVRTAEARRLLDSGGPIADVALAVGYADQSHLTHRFKKLLGITPGQYLRAGTTSALAPAAPGRP